LLHKVVSSLDHNVSQKAVQAHNYWWWHMELELRTCAWFDIGTRLVHDESRSQNFNS